MKIDKDDNNKYFKKKDLNVKILRENWWSTQIFFKDNHIYNTIPKVKCEISTSDTIK